VRLLFHPSFNFRIKHSPKTYKTCVIYNEQSFYTWSGEMRIVLSADRVLSHRYHILNQLGQIDSFFTLTLSIYTLPSVILVSILCPELTTYSELQMCI
jgi:hypothetical protein